MEFLLLLSANDKEIMDLIYKTGFSVEENTPLCLLGDKFFGFYKKKQQTVVICTKNAMKVGGYSIPKNRIHDDYNQTSIYIRRALRHEAVHVAQSCNNGKPLKMNGEKGYKLHPYKIDALKNSTMLSGNREKEYEAYWMEDRPKLVIKSLKKYCL